MSYLSFQELEALTQLANRGGIGTATALEDCIAKEPSQLMYCKNDHLIILKDLGDVLMASCEHVVGWVKRENLVQLTIAGTSSESKSSSPQIWDGNTERNIIKTTLTAPSPPPSGKTLQSAHHSIIQSPLQHPSAHSTFQGSQSGSKRISGPFELDSGIEPSHSGPGLPTYSHENKEGEVFLLPPRPPKSLHRQPSTSIETNHSFNLKARNQQPVDAPESGNEADGIVKSSMAHQTFEGSATLDHANPAPEAVTNEGCDSDHSWDIFGDYARESMYLPVQAHLSTTSTGTGSGTKTSSRRKPSQSTLELSEIRRPRASSDGRKTKDEHIASTDFKQEPQSDTNPSFKQYDTPSHYSGDDLNIPQDITTPKASIYPTPITPEFSDIHIDSKKLQLNPTADQSDSDSPKADSSILSLPQLSGHGEKDKYIIKQSEKEKENGTERSDSPPLLSHSLKLQPISRSLPLECQSHSPNACLSLSPKSSPSFPSSPSLWSPDSPASPHSIAATRQAVEARNRHLTERLKIATTLVGRMEDDLRGAKGPVPIRFLVNGEGLPTLEPTASDEQKQESKVIEVRMPSRIEQNGLPSPLVSRESVSRSNTQNSMRNTVYPLLSIPKRSVTAPPPSLSFTLNSGSNAQRQVLVSSNRPRSRSFSSSIARTLGVGRKASIPSALSLSVPGSSHGQEQIPTSANNKRNNFFNSSLAPQSPARSPSRYLFNSNSPASASLPHTLSIANNSVNSLPVPASATSSTFGFTAAFSGKGSRSSKKGSRSIIFPSPVSHKDFKEETVKADGMDFELVQPSLRNNPSSPSYSQSPYSPSVHPNHLTSSEEKGGRYEQDNAKTDQMLQSANPLATFGSGNHTNSTTGGVSLRLTVETDEWGFIKDKSPIPEIFSGKSEGGEVRQLEGRWLSIISTPLNGNPSKKVRKLVLESGVPNSLRGKVWAWFMAGTLSARVGGLYAELLGHDKGNEDERIDIDVVAAYSDHSIFAQTYSPGQQDLRSILRAYSNFAPAGYRSEMALIAGALLIHCVAEDSFWLLSGLVNTVLKDFYSKEQIGLKAVSEVFLRLLMKEEMKIGKLLKDVGIHPIVFLEKWFGQLFIRCLPWPTAMRVIDAVVCEGTRFLLVASLTILILSRDRLIRLPRKRDTILEYLFKLPQDSLLLPSHFMKACEAVKFDQKDYRNMKAAVEREMMIG
nr:hypothetical protein L204_00329 [Cryptococcus depauperatus CBS 7855]